MASEQRDGISFKHKQQSYPTHKEPTSLEMPTMLSQQDRTAFRTSLQRAFAVLRGWLRRLNQAGPASELEFLGLL